MGGVLAGLLIALAVVGAIGIVCAELTRGFWRGRPAVGIACAIVGVALVSWIQFIASWLSPPVGIAVSYLIVGLTLLGAGRVRIWRILQRHAGLVAIALGLALAYLGLLYLWGSADPSPFNLAALRFSFHTDPYPVDNAIPFLLANRIMEGTGTHDLIIGWNGSDRPPLQSGTILIVQTVFGGLGLRGDVLPFTAGMALQLMWVPALWALLTTLRVRPAVAALATVFVGSTATLLINTTYTWPKLASAALVLACFVALIEVARSAIPAARGVALAAAAFALAMLAHGAAAFVLPAVVALAVLVLVRHRRRLLVIGSGVVAALVVYGPWMLYQRFADPPGDRLLKWHLAGFTGIDDRSVARTLLDSFGAITPAQWIEARVANLRTVFSPFLFEGVTGTSEADIGAHRFHEYYETTAALSLATFLIIGIGIAVVVLALRRRPLPQRSLLAVMALMIPCILFWCLVIFLPANTVVHQGSHVWILVLAGGALAWLASRRFWLGVTATVLQAAVTLWFSVPFIGHGELRVSALLVLVGGVALTVLAVWWTARRERIVTATAVRVR